MTSVKKRDPVKELNNFEDLNKYTIASYCDPHSPDQSRTLLSNESTVNPGFDKSNADGDEEVKESDSSSECGSSPRLLAIQNPMWSEGLKNNHSTLAAKSPLGMMSNI
jgi:hypothetical protein